MSRGPIAVLVLGLITLASLAPAQRRPTTSRVPVQTPPGWPQQRADAGLPWPAGLGKKEALTGHIAAIDKDQMMVRSLDYGEVLFWTDSSTVVHVDKYPMSLSDLRIGNPVAVRLKNIKGRGPVATEILPHPDVRDRKQRGETAPPPAQPAASAHGGFVIPDTPAPPLPDAGAVPASAPAAPSAADFPALPRGASGVVGTVAAATADALEVRDAKNQTQKIIVTGVTQYKRASSGALVPGVKAGDRVAIIGDRLDSGEWVAREVLIALPETESASVASTGRAAQAAAVSKDGMARFSGVITSLGNEEVRVQTPSGERVVVVTAITEVRRMNTRGTFASLRKGDEVNVAGDVLEGGTVLAREITVTKLAGS